MFSMRSFTKGKCQGTITIKGRWPVLGKNIDVDGTEWDISAYGDGDEKGKGWCCAVLTSMLHPHYTSTAGESYGLVQQTWKAYNWKSL